MADFVIDNFKYGLDSRRSELTSQPGTLQDAVNLHVNQGGELEGRKAFTRAGVPTNSFGLEKTSAGPTVFGSVASGALSPALPAGYAYVRCQHPDGSTAMTSVLCSSSYGGSAVVVAKFTDGNVYGYYNGVLIKDFTNGLVLASLSTNALISQELTAEVNATSLYTAVQKISPNQNEFDVFSIPGSRYTVNEALQTASGTLVNAIISTGQAATTATPAIGSFSIIAGSVAAGTNKVVHVKVNAVDILVTSVDFVIDVNHTATAVASQINATQTTYVATASGPSVSLTTAVGGATANGFVVEITSAGNVCVGQCVFSLTLAAGATSFNITSFVANGVDVLGGSGVAWSTTLAQLAADLATAIRASATPGGYTAFASGNVVYFSKLVTSSGDGAISLTVNVSTGGGVVQGTTNPLSVSLNPPGLSVTQGFDNPTYTPLTFAQVFGGTGPYFYSWAWASGTTTGVPTSGPYFTCSNVFASNVTFSIPLVPHISTLNEIWQLTVTDSAGATAKVGIQVTYIP